MSGVRAGLQAVSGAREEGDEHETNRKREVGSKSRKNRVSMHKLKRQQLGHAYYAQSHALINRHCRVPDAPVSLRFRHARQAMP